jgi:uncharacterized protein YcfJ
MRVVAAIALAVALVSCIHTQEADAGAVAGGVTGAFVAGLIGAVVGGGAGARSQRVSWALAVVSIEP